MFLIRDGNNITGRVLTEFWRASTGFNKALDVSWPVIVYPDSNNLAQVIIGRGICRESREKILCELLLDKPQEMPRMPKIVKFSGRNTQFQVRFETGE